MGGLYQRDLAILHVRRHIDTPFVTANDHKTSIGMWSVCGLPGSGATSESQNGIPGTGCGGSRRGAETLNHRLAPAIVGRPNRAGWVKMGR
jgi:hypothetical protein